MTALFSGARRGNARRWIGFALALASVVLPALPLGPLFAQPPIPLAVLWAAYGWASDESPGWGAPVTLAALGLLHDQMAGGPYGLFAALYLFAFLIGRVIANLMSAPNLVSLWGGFIVTALAVVIVAALLARFALGAHSGVRQFAEAVAITALIYPLARPLYMESGGAFGGRS